MITDALDRGHPSAPQVEADDRVAALRCGVGEVAVRGDRNIGDPVEARARRGTAGERRRIGDAAGRDQSTIGWIAIEVADRMAREGTRDHVAAVVGDHDSAGPLEIRTALGARLDADSRVVVVDATRRRQRSVSSATIVDPDSAVVGAGHVDVATVGGDDDVRWSKNRGSPSVTGAQRKRVVADAVAEIESADRRGLCLR